MVPQAARGVAGQGQPVNQGGQEGQLQHRRAREQ